MQDWIPAFARMTYLECLKSGDGRTPMIKIRRSDERGHAEHGWLDSRHTFSFADYYDPAHMGFGPLRVINEDRVAPGQGFGRHGHRDMEILSYVLNGSLRDPVHFLQIWILPERDGIAPGYEQKNFTLDQSRGLTLVAGHDGRDGALTIHQDVDVYAARLAAGDGTRHVLREGRVAWLQVARGEVTLNGNKLSAGDGAAIEKETELAIEPVTSAEVLL